MNSRTLMLCAISLAAAAFVPACRNTALTGPPDIRLGRDACSDCGMIISEDRCCAAFVVEDGGDREHLLFDDLGCMLDTERRRLHGRHVLERYVRDHDSGRWLASDSAVFVFADPDKLPTPMGSGMVAYGAQEPARSAAQKLGGRVFGYADLLVARREWMEKRYGKPDTPDSP